jgi:hypothetical protein
MENITCIYNTGEQTKIQQQANIDTSVSSLIKQVINTSYMNFSSFYYWGYNVNSKTLKFVMDM